MYEVWADQAALDTHGKGANLGALAARFEELLVEPLRLESLRRSTERAAAPRSAPSSTAQAVPSLHWCGMHVGVLA